MDDTKFVAVCLATYNGEKYLAEQLESLLLQSYSNWKVYIRDDGSTDNTRQIIHYYEKKFPEKIVEIKGLSGGGNSQKNFAVIHRWVTENVDPDYYMFCDQDDYWLKDKIKISINAIDKFKDEPALCHSDLKVADSELRIISDSFIKYRALNPEVKDINHLLIQNNITGCTMIWNRELNEYIKLDNGRIAMHDWWIALIASSLGVIKFIPESTILYRQHGNNTVGATKVNTVGFIIKRLLGFNHVKSTFNMSFDQAEEFLRIYNGLLSNKDKQSIKTFLKIREENKIRRIGSLIKGGYLKQGKIQVLGELLFI